MRRRKEIFLKHRIFCILFILILAAGALFTAACAEPSQGSVDPSDKTPASDETTTVTESPTEATAEPSTEPFTEPTTESSTMEGETGTPETRRIQISYASRQLNAADKTKFLESYLRLLAFTEDVSGLDYLSDEVKANWDYLPYATADFTVSVVWEEENEFVVSCYRRSGKAIGEGLRYDLIVFQKDGERWIVSRDVRSDLWMMADVLDDTYEIVQNVFQKARAARPVTEEEAEAAKEAALERIVKEQERGWSEETLRKYREAQTLVYDSDWSDENLPKVLGWTYDYRNPVVLVYDYTYWSGWKTDEMLYVSLEKNAWTANYIGGGFRPKPPVEMPFNPSNP